MLNCALFHSQIASIVEVLAKTAIAEICELVDNGYATLQTEISRSQKENKALKRELQATKLRLAQQERKNRPQQASVNTGCKRVKICDELRAIAGKEGCFPNEESMLYRKSGGNQGEDRDHSFVDDEYNMGKPALKGKPAYLEEESCDLLIKEEGHEEDFGNSKHHGRLNLKDVLVESGDAETVPVLATQTTPTQDPGLLFEQERIKSHVLERSHLGALFHAESENETFNRSLEHQGSEQSPEKTDSLRNKYLMNDRPDQLNVLLSPLNSDRRTRRLTGSCATELNSQITPAGSEPPLGPFSDEYDDDSLCSLGSHDEKPDLIMIDSASVEFTLQPEEIEETMSETAENQHKRYREQRGEQGNYLHKGMSQSHTFGEQSTAFCDLQSITGNVFYEKSLNMLRSVEIYQEAETVGGRFVGTGPFSCLLCGKTFTQLGQLKKHQLVHTGEEQFKCVKCGKCFANSSNLKRHQTVHTGERPFSCTQCGKRFSFVGNLKRHQSVHIRKKPSNSSSLEGEV